MSDTEKGTSWIQNLRKEQIIAELEKRNVNYEKTDNYNELRKVLREVVKKEQSEVLAEVTDSTDSDADESTITKPVRKKKVLDITWARPLSK